MRLLAFVLTCLVAVGQSAKPPAAVVAGIPVNYDEALVGAYTLPDPLLLADGKPVRDPKTWNEKRRPEIVRLFEENQFGRAPGRPGAMSFEVFDKGTPAMGGKALRKQVTVYFSADKNGPREDIVIYVPTGVSKPVPLLLCLNFSPNSSIFDDPGIKLGEVWGRDKKKVPATRGVGLGRMNIDNLLAKGFGVAGIYYGDIEPDFLGGIQFGVRALCLKPGQSAPAPDEWGAIGAWAWGLSRAMDYLETDKSVDAKRVALYGVSRLGKTVMWAGAHDTRFAMVIASCSGEGGAALSRRNYGETIAHLTEPTRYAYQFAGNYGKFATHVDQLPVDAHMLVALIAPRPVFLQTGDKDVWSDPKGEFLAAVAAEPVYSLLGKQGLGTDKMPEPGEAILHTIGYDMHSGGHGTLPGDWDQFLKFMEMHFGAGQSEDRTADRAAIRAHIDRIFQAFIHKDSDELRATHAPNWLGYLERSGTMIRGVDGYMDASGYFTPGSPYGMKSYKMREFDMIFKGDAAFVGFIADVESNTPNGVAKRALRITDFYTKLDGQWIQTGSDTDLHPESAAEQYQVLRTLGDEERKQLLDAREAVWRAYFANDRATLERLIPEETLTIEAGGNTWGNRKTVFEGAAGFAQSGGKLVKLEFPKTEIQCYGFTAVVYSNYFFELEVKGRRSQQAGRVTEVFVQRDGQWVNPGWHMDSGK